MKKFWIVLLLLLAGLSFYWGTHWPIFKRKPHALYEFQIAQLKTFPGGGKTPQSAKIFDSRESSIDQMNEEINQVFSHKAKS